MPKHRKQCGHGSEHLRWCTSYNKKLRKKYTTARCKECEKLHRVARKINDPEKYKQARLKTKQNQIQRLSEFLGPPICNCCGSKEEIQIDHIIPCSRKHHDYGEALSEKGKGFQWLCRNCNRWKNNGPVCPCKYWDTISPGWR